MKCAQAVSCCCVAVVVVVVVVVVFCLALCLSLVLSLNCNIFTAQLGLLDLENRIKPVETGTVYFKWTVHSVAAGDCHTIVLGHSEKTSNTSGSSSEVCMIDSCLSIMELHGVNGMSQAPKAPTQVAGIVLVLLVGGVMFAAIGFYIRKTTIQRLRQVQLQRNVRIPALSLSLSLTHTHIHTYTHYLFLSFYPMPE